MIRLIEAYSLLFYFCHLRSAQSYRSPQITISTQPLFSRSLKIQMWIVNCVPAILSTMMPILSIGFIMICNRMMELNGQQTSSLNLPTEGANHLISADFLHRSRNLLMGKTKSAQTNIYIYSCVRL